MASGKNLLSCVMTLKNLLTLVQPCNWSNMIDCQDANFNLLIAQQTLPSVPVWHIASLVYSLLPQKCEAVKLQMY